MLSRVYVFISFDSNSDNGNDDREQPAECHQIKIYLPFTHHGYDKRIRLNKTVKI